MMRASAGQGPRVAGAALVSAAVLFLVVFTLLASSFGYPDVLDRPAEEVLPALWSLGGTGRAVWALYACIPLLLIPAAAGAARAHGAEAGRTLVRCAEWCATVSGMAMMLGLVRWPSLMWALAGCWREADAGQRAVLGAVFDGMNLMFGRFIGEFVGELLLNIAFVAFAAAAWRARQWPRWIAGFGITAGVLGGIGMWRNVTPLVRPVADVNNVVLPVWLIVWGVTLWRTDRLPGAEDARGHEAQ